MKLKNSAKCVNSRISTYSSFVATPQSPHEQFIYGSLFIAFYSFQTPIA
nr:MAG TPA: hypothetical protein [Caudoviricetes sp.]